MAGPKKGQAAPDATDAADAPAAPGADAPAAGEADLQAAGAAVEAAASEAKTATVDAGQGLHGAVSHAARAAMVNADHAGHAALHAIETLLGELKQKVAHAEAVLKDDALAVLDRIKQAL